MSVRVPPPLYPNRRHGNKARQHGHGSEHRKVPPGEPGDRYL